MNTSTTRKRKLDIFLSFVKTEQAAGIILILCAVISLILANSGLQKLYLEFWHQHITIKGFSINLDLSLEQWVNDGLMVIFFLLVGLEIKRELCIGELSNFKKASLPIMAALGGMIVPAITYALVNKSHPATIHGWGVPMATDIAFALGVFSLLGKKASMSAKTFLMALAVIDDLGAIIVIAIFYSAGILWMNLIIALGIFIVLIILNFAKVSKTSIYLMLGAVMWYFLLKSGVHATIAGVLIAITIPIKSSYTNYSPLETLEHNLHDIAGFVVMPLFALANTAIILDAPIGKIIETPIAMGIIFGLCLGKPLGITLFTYISTKINLGQLPKKSTMKDIVGIGFLAGIGFTMSMLISVLAFKNDALKTDAKIAVLIASLISAIIGYMFIKSTKKQA
ncbi:MAG: Na+/H+ antiporter NhaA [Solitalea-like symbiont of Acarus siro]